MTGIRSSDRDEPELTGGTVGAVALDAQRHLAAATSTGGTTGQLTGRIGDTPLVGAGTWADDRSCAVSATGDGEALILSVFAHEVEARAGTGGCIAVGPDGTVVMPFTSAGMFRDAVDATGDRRIGMFTEDPPSP